MLPEAWTLLVLSCTYIYGNEGRLDLGQIAEGDKVGTRLIAVGKHEGDLPGAPRTGNDLQMTSITIHRMVDGKLVEKWAEKDWLGFLPQIGVMPAPDHATG